MAGRGGVVGIVPYRLPDGVEGGRLHRKSDKVLREVHVQRNRVHEGRNYK